MSDRRQESYAVRLEAAELARSRQHPSHQANGDEQRYAGDQYFMSFTKGLPHNEKTGLLQDPQDFVEFRRSIDDGFIDPFTDRVRHGAKYKVNSATGAVEPETNAEIIGKLRQWEAPTAGTTYELQGPDAQAVTMPPAPPLLDASGKVNPELALEMAEVYELAILRDQPFNAFEKGSSNGEIDGAIARLNALSYVKNQTGRPRKVNSDGEFDPQTVFRGSSPGVEVGPYLSQFLLIGNTDQNGGGSVAEGKITYGALQIDQKVPIAEPRKNYMVTMPDYVEVQRGIKPPTETYGAKKGEPVLAPVRPPRRFISTPRDLATYVHYDALYEAYLNACIVLLGMGTPFDSGFDQLAGGDTFVAHQKTRRNAGGFALYGGPHILNLVTEVATRGLKAVRFQKFNNHIRLRPEALAAKIELLHCGATVPAALASDVGALKDALQDTLNAIERGPGCNTHFLPMAFPEGSPMHPAYGAGHATVAGACITILKAFFDTSSVLAKTASGAVAFKRLESSDTPVVFRAPTLPHPTTGEGASAGNLVCDTANEFLTLEGELNKLAANISIGRDMAGVHYFSDYYDSLRMGEQIAIGILEEQALTYSTDPFVLSVPTFDGDVVRIGNR
ncbi:vanadium-dependent haloperoxidase [Leptolyngbya cf. ectocarpi LEGE 11479]|uniref:Vanadium-dependent haloperoxidase n=1 Tax=Leptolyngbya cf. ectocarpi LEGE 11479 TaxID=1828722 RepID=A0A928X0I0_LEPEC|nr:vanadium-dependent haloperoxidase [Leptolyngbya ectocarpi]MBE9066697.1 vanadium-dependent haloperoxidase [Leptolyngbya cf. ectocarpi LEGE 11479]